MTRGPEQKLPAKVSRMNLAKESYKTQGWQSLLLKLGKLRKDYLAAEAHCLETEPEHLPKGLNLRQTGSSIRIGERLWTIKSVLGSGQEGITYEVFIKGESCAVKEFRRRDVMSRHIEAYREFISAGVPMPKLLEVSPESRAMRVQHIEAVPVPYLIFKCADTLSESEQFAWKRAVASFIEQHPQAMDFQLIMRVRDGKLFCVDPR